MSRYARAFLISALAALLVAAVLHLLAALALPSIWPALVHLSFFGWISGMILAVNYHTLPVFSGRSFPSQTPIWLHWASFSAGFVLTTLGIGLRWRTLEAFGLALELLAALLFLWAVMGLMLRGKRHARHPVPPIPDQAQIDRVGTRATTAAGLALPIVQLLLLAVRLNWIGNSWLLAAEHLSALGWVMLMIVGVAYHVLPRFSGQATRGLRWASAQLWVHLLAVLMIVFGLGLGLPKLFALGALSMTLGLALFAWTIWPTLQALRPIAPQVIRLHTQEPRP
jgi:hypothetical protein